jgi:hypothetical protein
MFKSKNATSIVEVMVIMLIILVWTVWMYTIFGKWQNLSNTTENRIQAIQIAREWLEAMINIRDTNYLLYSANYANCWNTLNYNWTCVTTATNDTSTDILAKSYKIYQDTDSRWKLLRAATWNYSNTTYRTDFKVMTDSNWLYSQSWWTDTKPLFTREIKVSYPVDSNSQEMDITSLVQWSDSSKQWVLKVELSTKIFNFKNKN